jgi:hypothetical protein
VRVSLESLLEASRPHYTTMLSVLELWEQIAKRLDGRSAECEG